MPRGQAPQTHEEAFYRFNRPTCDNCFLWRGLFFLTLACGIGLAWACFR